MRILYLRLKGYGGIYHGMGRDQIEIPFSDFKNNIVLIQGANGCGKSTILQSASMEIDGSESYRTDIIYKDTDQGLIKEEIEHHAEKEIHIQDGEDVYRALIISPVNSSGKRGTTKAFFARNGEELNPNGNVSSYKDIKNTMLDIDPNYMALSLISSEKRGLVDKTPSDRKRFMSSVIDTLEFFNNCYKTLSKKSSVMKSNINNIKSKIFNIGDPSNLIASLSISENRLTELSNQRNELIEKIAECNATIKILDPNNEIQALYQSIVDELSAINFNINKYSNSLDTVLTKFSKSYQNDVYEEKASLEHTYNSVSNNMQIDKNTLSFRLQNREVIQSKIEELKNRLSSLQSSEIRSDIESVVDDIKEELKLCEALFQSTDIDISISKQEWLTAKSILDNIKSSIVKIWGNNSDDIKTVMDIIKNSLDPFKEKMLLEDEILATKQQISNYRQRLSDLDNVLDIVSILDKRPSNCSIDTCPFIEQAMKYNRAETINEINLINTDIESCNDKIIKLEEKKKWYNQIMESYQDMNNLVKYISSNKYLLSRIGSICDNVLDIDILMDRILSHYSFNEFLSIDERINMIDVIENYKKKKENLIKLEADLTIFNNNKSMLTMLESEMEKSISELQETDTNIEKLNKSIKFNTELIISMKSDLDMMDTIISLTDQLKDYNDKKKELGEKFKQVKSSIASVKEKVDQLELSKQALVLLDNEYNPLKDNIDKMKFALDKLESYRTDLLKMEDRFEKIEFLKKACSPSSTGIQHLYISMYMSKTVLIANDLLRLLFDGNLKILTPIIDESEFRIPFQNRNGIVSDIGMGSTSQQCMFGMTLGFALLSQGSERYNIMRLDEVDGGLDDVNTMGFTTRVIPDTMNIMNIEQCIMISHKIETETYNADIIYVNKNGITFSTQSS